MRLREIEIVTGENGLAWLLWDQHKDDFQTSNPKSGSLVDSYQELDSVVNRFGSLLQSVHLKRGEKIKLIRIFSL